MTAVTGEFSEAVAAYRRAVLAAGLPVASDLSAETAVESARDWSRFGDLDELKAWFLAQRAANTMRVTKVPMNECDGWVVDPSDGYIRHVSGRFFSIEAIRVALSTTREVGTSGWCQPVLTQIGDDGGVLGLVRCRFDGVPHYLIQAKAEPGNHGLVSLSPSVQATFSNLEQAHGGRFPTHAELFYPVVSGRCTELTRAWLAEDGGRLFNKRNLGIVVELAAGESIELSPDYRWASMWQIKQLFGENAWVNPHLFRLVSMMGA